MSKVILSNAVFDSIICRVFTGIAAFIVFALVFVLPQMFGNEITNENQSMLSILMLGSSIGFIYSFGFKFKSIIMTLLTNPIVAWLLMIIGTIYFVIY